jgi:RNA-binding protein
MTSKERAYLRKLATSIQPIFQIGKGEISDEMATQIGNALEARELIKIKVLENCVLSPRQAAEILSEKTNSEVVSVIGTRFILFRTSKKHPKIDLSIL